MAEGDEPAKSPFPSSVLPQPEDHQQLSPLLPGYPQMILAAIDHLKEGVGSSESTISGHIEVTYPNVSAEHSTLLSHYLNRMLQDGELVMVNNNYMRPNAPPKRGRGRPPKPKEPVPPGTEPATTGTPRGRGRPPKVKDPMEPTEPSLSASTEPRRGRGRPPKVKDPLAPPPPSSGKPRGRPPKKAKVEKLEVVLDPTSAPWMPAEAEEPKRGRGRPPKVKPVVEA